MAELRTSAMVTVDLHGMNRYQAKIALDNALKRSRNVYRIKVIHGYRNGDELRTLVREEYARHPSVKRIIAVSDGATELVIREI